MITFADNHPEWLERWDAAEPSVLCGLADWDLRDCFRLLHGYARQDASWVLHTHGWREAGLSDHSAIEAIFEPEPLTDNTAPPSNPEVDPDRLEREQEDAERLPSRARTPDRFASGALPERIPDSV